MGWGLKRNEVACQDGQLKRDIVLRWDGDVNDLGRRLGTEEVRNEMDGHNTTSRCRNCVKRKCAVLLVFD